MDTAMTAQETVSCMHDYTVYANEDHSYMVVKYTDQETGKKFSARGAKLPEGKSTQYQLHGRWVEDKKYGKQFSVDYVDVLLPVSKDGVVSYLSSLRCGLGKLKAAAIYDKFGERVWDILDNNPRALLSISGISKGILEKLLAKLAENRVQLELYKAAGPAADLLNPFMLNAFIAWCESQNLEPLETMRRDPYCMTHVHGFSFATVDAIAQVQPGYKPTCPGRLVSGIFQVFSREENNGHVCLPMDLLIQKMVELLNKNQPNSVTADDCKHGLNLARKMGSVKVTSGFAYPRYSYDQETGIVSNISRLMQTQAIEVPDIDDLIHEYEVENGIELAENQKEAVRSAIRNPVNIITGGPGTGKTTTTKAIIAVYKKVHHSAEDPVLLAPTGRAARRMAEATGYNAQTIHSAVGYTGVEVLDDALEPLEGDLFIVDESSMADQFITSTLLDLVPGGATLIFVGDPDQLPSVGAGNILHEFIRSEVIPTVCLKVIFRQANDNPIVANAQRIHDGETELDYSCHTFVMYERANSGSAFKTACSLYLQAVKKFGIENVILLDPFRKKTDLSVDAMNKYLQDQLNPVTDGMAVMKANGREFRPGDRVMQTKNTNGVMNGDIGKVVRIDKIPSPDNPSEWQTTAFLQFDGEDDVRPYTKDDLADVDLAYCNTIHKSQGSEYDTVILVIHHIHKAMLKRNLIYTAITRAKKNVAIVGELSAVAESIRNNKADARYTLLGDRLHAKLGGSAS